MDKMTPQERMTYARGKVRSNLENMRTTLDHQRRDSLNKRQMWIVTVCSTAFLLAAGFFYHGLQNLQDAIFYMSIIASFVVIQIMCYHIISNQIMFSDLLMQLYSDLANSETLRFGVEEMADDSKPNQ